MKIFEFSLFGLSIAPTYYGLMYVLGFLYGIWAIKKTGKYKTSQVDDLFIYIFAWVILWWRLWYVLFYNPSEYLSSPLDIFKVWEWWMSFHGWMLGVILASYIFSKRNKVSFLMVMDHIATIVPVGLFLGRIWNYLNKELLWFPYDGFLSVKTNSWSFFPSPLVEALLEGIFIFFILHFVAQKQKFSGQLAFLFLILYGVFRILVELFIRTPDIQIGYYFGFITQGSILSGIMLIGGILLYLYFQKKDVTK